MAYRWQSWGLVCSADPLTNGIPWFLDERSISILAIRKRDGSFANTAVLFAHEGETNNHYVFPLERQEKRTPNTDALYTPCYSQEQPKNQRTDL